MLGSAWTRSALRIPAALVVLGMVLQGGALSAKTAAKKSSKPVEKDSPDIEVTVEEPAPATKGKKKQPAKKGKTSEVEVTETPPTEEVELEETPAPPPPPVEKPATYKKNWLSLSVQQDMLFYPSQKGVCKSSSDPAGGAKVIPGASQYECRDANGVYPDPVYSGAGNEVQAGFGFATTRVLLGYDRVLGGRFTAGGRLGYAFRTAPSVEGGGSSFPVHIEARGAFYFGSAPFERDSLRPFVSLGIGIGEIDGVVNVEYYKSQEGFASGKSGRLNAWRRTGTAFGALGAGLSYPLGSIALNAELRAIGLVGAPAAGAAIAIGAAYGL